MMWHDAKLFLFGSILLMLRIFLLYASNCFLSRRTLKQVLLCVCARARTRCTGALLQSAACAHAFSLLRRPDGHSDITCIYKYTLFDTLYCYVPRLGLPQVAESCDTAFVLHIYIFPLSINLLSRNICVCMCLFYLLSHCACVRMCVRVWGRAGRGRLQCTRCCAGTCRASRYSTSRRTAASPLAAASCSAPLPALPAIPVPRTRAAAARSWCTTCSVRSGSATLPT